MTGAAGRRLRWTVRRLAGAAAVCVGWAVAASGAGGADAASGGALTIQEVVRLSLSNSRAAIAARLGRGEEGLTLESAEERYDPKIDFSVGADAASRGDETAEISLGPSLRVPTGGTFRLSWRKPVAGEGDREASTDLTFSQPLAERRLDVEQRKLQQGLSSAFQLGRFEDDLVAAQRRGLAAVARYRDSRAGLDGALGTTLDRRGVDVEQVGR